MRRQQPGTEVVRLKKSSTVARNYAAKLFDLTDPNIKVIDKEGVVFDGNTRQV